MPDPPPVMDHQVPVTVSDLDAAGILYASLCRGVLVKLLSLKVIIYQRLGLDNATSNSVY